MDLQIYQHNQALFSKVNPHAAKAIEGVTIEGRRFVKSRCGEDNIYLEDKGYYLHANYSAKKEAQRWFDSLNLAEVKVLFVFGVGLGYYYEPLKTWLEQSPDHYLVFIENDPTILKCFLHTKLASSLINDPQVQLHLVREFEEEGSAVFSFLSWFFVMMQVEVGALESYEKNQSSFYDTLSLKLLHQVAHDGGLAKEYLQCHELFFRNFYHNLAMMNNIYHGNQLFNQFKGIPAIICGAGPSLDKNIASLRKWQQKALIFAGGSSINALSSHGLSPHFGGGIDPNRAQLERSVGHSLFSLPIFYRNRWNRSSLEYTQGPRLYLNGCGGYSIADWFEKELDLEGQHLEEGHNIINFLLEVATHLGCNPIIFVGMDLSFTGGKNYAGGIVKDTRVGEQCMKQLSVIQRKDIHGKPLQTLRKWVMESEWISNYAKQHTEMAFFNATGEGLGFKGVENTSLQALEKSLKPLSHDYSSLVHHHIQKVRVEHINALRVMKSFGKLKNSLERCNDIIQQLKGLLEKAEKKAKKMKLQKDFMDSPKVQELEKKLTNEPAYTYILEELNSVRVRLLQRRLNELSRDKNKHTKTAKTIEGLKINQERLFFLKQVAASNLQTMQQTIELLNKKGYDTQGYEAI